MKHVYKKLDMLFYNYIKKIAYTFIKLITYKIINKTPICCIEEINLSKKTIVIHCKGIDAPIKLTFDEIINDPIILANLSSKQASWAGYYYGKHSEKLTNKKHSYNNVYDFSINQQQGKYNIIMLNRCGNLIYSNQNTGTRHTISPINAIADEDIILGFTSTQACYIGILAGISTLRKLKKETPLHSHKIHLHLIK